MGRRMRLWLFLAGILTIMGMMSACMDGNANGGICGAAVAAWQREIGESTEETCRMQENLALWYNHGLRHGEDPEILAEAYDGILDCGGGLMGILEVPEAGIRMPVYHDGTGEGTGLRHDPGTPFPIGGDGNHTVLRGSVGQLNLEAGDVFCIHIPGMKLTYHVQQVVSLENPPEAVDAEPEADQCTLMLADDENWLLICGSREETGD